MRDTLTLASPAHAVCITGLERSFPEIHRNVHLSLLNLYGGADDAARRRRRPSVNQLLERRLEGAERGSARLGRLAAFFGVRPANDSWATVKAGGLPPLAGESVQTPCGENPDPPWFSAFSRSNTQRVIYRRTFVQVLCDLAACHELVKAHERRVGRPFETIARLRLDLAWEAPLTMPPTPLRPNTVYTTRMNTKSGVNDKWAIGLRAPMAAYLDRVALLRTATAMYNRSGAPAARLAGRRSDGLASYDCSEGRTNTAFACHAQSRNRTTSWQDAGPRGARAPSESPTRKFIMTSEGFLQWALWRHNVSVGYEPKWMFCKYKLPNPFNDSLKKCIPRMRQHRACPALVCSSSSTDCVCREAPCGSQWYCEDVVGKQLFIDHDLVGAAAASYPNHTRVRRGAPMGGNAAPRNAAQRNASQARPAHGPAGQNGERQQLRRDWRHDLDAARAEVERLRACARGAGDLAAARACAA